MGTFLCLLLKAVCAQSRNLKSVTHNIHLSVLYSLADTLQESGVTTPYVFVALGFWEIWERMLSSFIPGLAQDSQCQ